MKTITLTNGKITMVDAEDFEALSKFTWYYDDSKIKTGYAFRMTNNKKTRMHRQVMGYPKQGIDHINRDGLDNRKSNLRLVSQSENCMNKSMQSNNKTGYIGVCYDKQSNKYAAHIKVGKRFVRIGRYPTAYEAALVRDCAACLFYGAEFANFNVLGESHLAGVRNPYRASTGIQHNTHP